MLSQIKDAALAFVQWLEKYYPGRTRMREDVTIMSIYDTQLPDKKEPLGTQVAEAFLLNHALRSSTQAIGSPSNLTNILESDDWKSVQSH